VNHLRGSKMTATTDSRVCPLHASYTCLVRSAVVFIDFPLPNGVTLFVNIYSYLIRHQNILNTLLEQKLSHTLTNISKMQWTTWILTPLLAMIFVLVSAAVGVAMVEPKISPAHELGRQDDYIGVRST
jgi:hypothetical protein